MVKAIGRLYHVGFSGKLFFFSEKYWKNYLKTSFLQVDFMLIHKSYLVRIDEIESIYTKISRSQETWLPVGRTYYPLC